MNRPPIVIRSVKPSDASRISAYMADPEVFANLMQLPFPREDRWAERLGAPMAGSNDMNLVAEIGGEVVGSAGLFATSAHVRRRHASVLGISVAREAQGRGVGSALLGALVDYADRWGQILRIELTVFADNARAIGLYERFGFQREGLFRRHALRDGQYADTVAMARLHPNPPRWESA